MNTREIQHAVWDDFRDTLEASITYEPHYAMRLEPVPADQEEAILMQLGLNDDVASPQAYLHTPYVGFTWRFAEPYQPDNAYAEVQVLKNLKSSYTGYVPRPENPNLTDETRALVQLYSDMRSIEYGSHSILRRNELVSNAKSMLLRQPGLIVHTALNGEVSVSDLPEDIIYNSASLELDQAAPGGEVAPFYKQMNTLTTWIQQPQIMPIGKTALSGRQLVRR